MHPFRSGHRDPAEELAPSEVVRDAVSQMVQQFADPLAFYRELVQNSLDAGATEIHVRLAWEPGAEGRGVLRASVTDDGSGMDLATLERCLLVLFRSTKDHDPTKIGKFGVGFFSVLAPSPEVVLVDTGTGPDGYRVTLHPNHTYEVSAAPARRGTTVTLRLPTSSTEAAQHARRAAKVLATWCPHVAVPLYLDTTGVPGFEQRSRINTPFGVEALVSVLHTEGDRAWAVGVPEDPQRASGAFYNRGILLRTLEEPLVPGVVFKASDPALTHTLSRDDVRRDSVFDRSVNRVRELARGPLRAGLLTALYDAALASARARHQGADDPEARHRLASLYLAVLVGTFALRPQELTWPLVHPTALEGGGAVAVTSFSTGLFSRSPRLYAPGPDALTAALARYGVPVVDLGAAGASGQELLALLRQHFGEDVAAAGERYGAPGLVEDDALGEPALSLLTSLREALALSGLRQVSFAKPTGAGADRLFLTVPSPALQGQGGPALIDAQDTQESPFALFSSRGVAINLGHPRVRAALQASRRDCPLAAFLLARLVLLSAGALDAARDRALLAHLAGQG